MIKAGAQTEDGKPVLMLGLTKASLDRLQSGMLLHIPASHIKVLGLPDMEVVIQFGESEGDILAEIAGYGIGADIVDLGSKKDG